MKKGNITSFVHIEKVFDIVPREFMEWTKYKKFSPENNGESGDESL